MPTVFNKPKTNISKPETNSIGSSIKQGMATGVGVGGLLGLGGIGLVDLLTGRKMSKGIMKGVKGVGSKISNAGKGIKNYFGKGGGVADDLAEATVKKHQRRFQLK